MILRAVVSASVVAGLVLAPTVAQAKPPPIDKKCQKQFRRETGNLQMSMDATLATWEAAKTSAEADIADMKRTIANPQESVSLDALKSGALVKASSIAASLEDERDRNLADVKAFDKRFLKCFSTPAGKKQFGAAVSLVRAGFKEMASAKWSIWEVWTALGEANTSRADEQLQNTLVDVIAAEPTFDQGMARLSKLD